MLRSTTTFSSYVKGERATPALYGRFEKMRRENLFSGGINQAAFSMLWCFLRVGSSAYVATR